MTSSDVIWGKFNLLLRKIGCMSVDVEWKWTTKLTNTGLENEIHEGSFKTVFVVKWNDEYCEKQEELRAFHKTHIRAWFAEP